MTETATAAGSGANATATFAKKERTGAAADPARVSAIATDTLQALHDVIRKHQVTYAEYDALKAWLIQVGADGEWPLFLDVFVEHVVEEVANADRHGAVGTIEGPYYVPDAPVIESGTAMPMRPDEKGTPCCSRAPSPTSTAPRSPARRSTCGTPTTRATTPSSPRHPRVEPARGHPHRRRRALRVPHHAARAVPDPDRRLDRRVHLRGRLAPVAPRAPAPQGVRARQAARHHPAVLRRRRLRRRRRRPAVKPELILRPGPAADGTGNEVTYDFALDPA